LGEPFLRIPDQVSSRKDLDRSLVSKIRPGFLDQMQQIKRRLHRPAQHRTKNPLLRRQEFRAATAGERDSVA
jgi:hypothetical protein